MDEFIESYLAKARESLEGAESEWANGRYNNAANRSYYACCQAAIHGLAEAGIRPIGTAAEWKHAAVQAAFAGVLIGRRKLYPGELRDALMQTMRLRHTADYQLDRVTDVQATRALRLAARFVSAVEQRSRAR